MRTIIIAASILATLSLAYAEEPTKEQDSLQVNKPIPQTLLNLATCDTPGYTWIQCGPERICALGGASCCYVDGSYLYCPPGNHCELNSRGCKKN